MFEDISQIAIFILGAGSIFLLAKKNKWGFVIGIVCIPFYFITAYINKQWGIFFVNFLYLGSYCYGVYEWFFKDKDKKVDK
jgi:nicotinamide riboside transporter PnuC